LKRIALFALVSLVVACGSSSSGGNAPPQEDAGTAVTVQMHFDRQAGFYAAPWPSEDMRNADGTIAIDGFPNPNNVQLVQLGTQLIKSSARGFGQTTGVFFTTTDAIDPTGLPDLATSMTPNAKVFIVGVDKSAPDFMHRYPVHVAFVNDGGPFGAPNLLSAVPLQGAPLRPQTTYAAVVMKTLKDTNGNQLGVSSEMQAIAAGMQPTGMSAPAFAAYQAAFSALTSNGIAGGDIAGLAVFKTDAPTAQMAAVRADILSHAPPTPNSAFHLTDTFPTYCVYATTIGIPDYQAGDPPYDFGSTGGGWQFDASNKPIVQRTEQANFVVTVPRAAMPASGFPMAVVVRTGMGGDRPLVDRGPQPMTGAPATTPGTGPALHFAAVGYAGAQFDGPHGGLRNPTNGNEDFIMFNVFNPVALRDNVRETAIELVLFEHILEGITFDASDCAGLTGGPMVKFDMTRAALMGHSMGATVAPLVLAFEPKYGAAILSGAGGSYIENVLYKTQPLNVKPDIELLIEYESQHLSLTENDPVLSLFQWAEEPSDTQVYANLITREPANGEPSRHILMEQGIVDHYILPAIANSLSMPLKLDLAGTELDTTNAELQMLGEPTLTSMFPFSGQTNIQFPVQGNFMPTGGGSPVTAIVVQHPSDGIEDGHEVVFQTDAPKNEYRCFLKSYAPGGPAPKVPMGTTPDAPCP
jgi:hypothetical protein